MAQWTTIRLVLTLTAVLGWHSKQLDYVAAYPQAPVERELYMKIPAGITLRHGRHEDYILKLHKNVYGQKQAGRVWFEYLRDKLSKEVGFTQSRIDSCLFYRGRTIGILYTNDSILAGPDSKDINAAVAAIQEEGLDITDEGDIGNFSWYQH